MRDGVEKVRECEDARRAVGEGMRWCGCGKDEVVQGRIGAHPRL